MYVLIYFRANSSYIADMLQDGGNPIISSTWYNSRDHCHVAAGIVRMVSGSWNRREMSLVVVDYYDQCRHGKGWTCRLAIHTRHVLAWSSLQWHDVHTEFHENPYSHSWGIKWSTYISEKTPLDGSTMSAERRDRNRRKKSLNCSLLMTEREEHPKNIRWFDTDV